MFPTSLATNAQPFDPTSPVPSLPFQNNAVATMTLMPPASYSVAAGTGGTVQSTVYSPAGGPQHSIHQPVVFSGNTGNFFFAQSPSIGTAPVLLAPGQAAPPGAFVVAQPVPAAAHASTGSAMPAASPANCIIRLPDGRFVLPAQSLSSAGLSTPTGTHLHSAQPTYFPVSISTTGSSPQQHVGLLAPSAGQAFYIQVPSTLGGFGGAVIASTCTATSASFQPQPTNTMLRPVQSTSCIGSVSLQNRHPVLVSSSVPTFANQGVNSPKISIPSSISFSTSTCRMTFDSQKVCGAVPSCAMTVGQLPNGAYTAVSYPSQPSPAPSLVGDGSFKSTSTSTGNRRHNSNVRSRQDASSNSAVTVLHRLDEQIRILRSMSTLSEVQTARLKQLVDVRDQLSKASNTNTSGSGNDATPNSQTISSNSDVPDISLPLRRELLDLLARNSLLPRVTSPLNSESVIIEFRLNAQRYNLRLTKQQKTDIERLLYSVNSQRQAEILTVLQQEQARIYGGRTRMLAPTNVPSNTPNCPSGAAVPANLTLNVPAQSLRLPSQVHAFSPISPSLPVHQPTFGGSSGLRLVAARQVVPAPGMANTIVRGTPITIASTTPVMGLVTALAIPPIPGQAPIFAQNVCSTVSAASSHITGSNTQPSGLFLSSAMTPGTPTFVVQQPVIVPPSPMDSAVLTAAVPTLPHSESQAHSQAALGQSLITEPTSLSLASLNQASRMSRLRACLIHDLKCAVDRPQLTAEPNSMGSCPSPIQLLELLAPFHVHQDGDNTKEALHKVDCILENASTLILERKRKIIDAVNAQLYRSSMHQLETPLEDRLILSRMALDLERDVFEIERAEFNNCADGLGVHDQEKSTPGHELKSTVTDSNSSKSEDILVGNPTLSLLQQRLEHRRLKIPERTYFKHTNPAYPSPWPSLLGPLAFLRPLKFNRGVAEYASIDLPQLSASVDTSMGIAGNAPYRSQSPCSTEQTTTSDSSKMPQCISAHSVNEDERSADEAEADLLLGLDVRQSRTRTSDKSATTNGLLHDRKVLDSGLNQASDEASGFDETYDLWQELMREEGMDLDGMESDSCLDGASTSLLSDQTSKKSGLLENGSTDSVQHSEDPDLDAAIRSILTSSR